MKPAAGPCAVCGKKQTGEDPGLTIWRMAVANLDTTLGFEDWHKEQRQLEAINVTLPRGAWSGILEVLESECVTDREHLDVIRKAVKS